MSKYYCSQGSLHWTDLLVQLLVLKTETERELVAKPGDPDLTVQAVVLKKTLDLITRLTTLLQINSHEKASFAVSVSHSAGAGFKWFVTHEKPAPSSSPSPSPQPQAQPQSATSEPVKPTRRLMAPKKQQAINEHAFDSVIGLQTAKDALLEATVFPLMFPEQFAGGNNPWSAILLYGPPGTGKTELAKACAAACGSTFKEFSARDVMDRYYGESERKLGEIFDAARKEAPCILFFDEIDWLSGERKSGEQETMRRVKSLLLQQMSNTAANRGVLVLGATNTPWEIDAAFRRRFEQKIYVPLPEEHDRLLILRHFLLNTKHSLSQENLQQVAASTPLFSGADIKTLVKEATSLPMRDSLHAAFFRLDPKTGTFSPVSDRSVVPSSRDVKTLMKVPKGKLKLPVVDMTHFERALQNITANVSQQDLQRFAEFTEQFGKK